MSTVTYNGITLVPVRTVEIEETPVLSDDGTEFLWMRYRLTVEARYHPQFTSYNPELGVAEPGFLAAETDEAIRFYLEQPRRPLLYQDTLPGNGTWDILVSPARTGENQFGLSDANNGPVPLEVRVRKIDGSKMWHVSFSIETYVNECQGENQTNPMLLSNRYSVAHDIDERFFTVKVSEGLAVFRTDVLSRLGALADQFRNILFPPIRPGMRRRNIKVKVGANLNQLQWVCVDEEMPYDLGDGTVQGTLAEMGVLEADAQIVATSVNLFEIAAIAGKVGGGFLKMLPGAAKGEPGFPNPDTLGDVLRKFVGKAAPWVAGVGSAVVAGMWAAGGHLRNMVVGPLMFVRCTCTVKGGRDASNWNLLQAAAAITEARFSGAWNDYGSWSIEVHKFVTESLTDRDVTVETWRLMLGNINVVDGLTTLLDPLNYTLFRQRQTTVFPDQLGINPVPVRDFGTRGVLNETIIQNALREGCGDVNRVACTLTSDWPFETDAPSWAAYCGDPPDLEVEWIDQPTGWQPKTVFTLNKYGEDIPVNLNPTSINPSYSSD